MEFDFLKIKCTCRELCPIDYMKNSQVNDYRSITCECLEQIICNLEMSITTKHRWSIHFRKVTIVALNTPQLYWKWSNLCFLFNNVSMLEAKHMTFWNRVAEFSRLSFHLMRGHLCLMDTLYLYLLFSCSCVRDWDYSPTDKVVEKKQYRQPLHVLLDGCLLSNTLNNKKYRFFNQTVLFHILCFI